MPRNSHLKWAVNYEPGKLEAIAYKNGKRLYKKIETTGIPAEVVVTPYKTTILADGKDVSVLNITVLDREGREVPDADNLVKFEIEGPGKIIGVEMATRAATNRIFVLKVHGKELCLTENAR